MAPAKPDDLALAVRGETPELTPFESMERLIASGDMASMQPVERMAHYWHLCESLGLNPLTQPFQFVSYQGKLTLYPTRGATDQLRSIHGVTVTSLRRESDDALGLLTIFAHGRDKTGREDESTGVVFVRGLSGQTLADAMMKCETKAKRRLTLSLVGLGMLDETEIADGGGVRVEVDPTTGVITELPTQDAAPDLLSGIVAQAQALAAQPAAPAPAPQVVKVDGREVASGSPISSQSLTISDLAPGEATAAPISAPETVEGVFVDREAAPYDQLVAKLREAAAASELDQAEGSRTGDQRERLALVFAGRHFAAGLGLLWNLATPRQISQAQAQAILVAHEAGPVSFLELWDQLNSAGEAH
jgi:hypothetical protein